jgi:hypothetical protein
VAHCDELTILIEHWQKGSREAGDALMEKLYPELKKIAPHISKMSVGITSILAGEVRFTGITLGEARR